MKTDFKCAPDAARNIVLVMVRRSSLWCLLSARATEAHNAAESARRVYYHGMDAL